MLALALNIEQSHFNVRLGEPLRAWASIYKGDVSCKTFEECDVESIALADVVVIQRHLDVHVMKIITTAVRLGKKIIFEIDDLLINLPEFLSHHKVNLARYAATLESILPQVDCITVTTKRLSQHLAQYARPTAVIPNCAGASGLMAINQNTWQAGVATLIVASSDAVLVDFILPAIAELMLRKDMALKVLVIGPPGNAFDKAGIQCTRMANLTYDEFKKFIRTISNPIGIIPLDDSVFSSCKSPVKYFDYSLAGIPVICSHVPPYSDVIENSVTGILVDNITDSWVSAIEQLVLSLTKRKQITEQACTFVESEYSTVNAAKNWNVLLSKLIAGGFNYNPPVKASVIKQAITKLRHLLTHLFRHNQGHCFKKDFFDKKAPH